MDNLNSSSMEDDRLLSQFGVTPLNILYRIFVYLKFIAGRTQLFTNNITRGWG